MAKKKFKDTVLGKIIGKVILPNIPVVGPLLESAFSTADLIDKIADSPDLSPEDKAMLRVQILNLEEKQLERDIVAQQEVTKRWVSDNNAGMLTRFVRPSLLIVLTCLLLFFTYLDSAEGIQFSVEDKWVEMWSYLTGIAFGAYFLGKSAEKTFRK